MPARRRGEKAAPADQGALSDHDPSAASELESELPSHEGTISVHGPTTPRVSDSFLKPSFTLEQIRTFLVVAAREHVTHAAKTLGLSQPAVTQQVHLLERALGVKLLERVGRNVRLTNSGLEVAGACLLIMRSVENLESIVSSVQSLELGSLSIAASQVTASYYLPAVLASFTSKYPAIDVDITITDTPSACNQISSGMLECGLVDAPLPDTDLLQTQTAKDQVVLAAHPHHPLAGQERMCLKQPSRLRYLVWEPDGATETIASELLGAAYDRLPRVHLGSLEAVRQSLLAGLGFAAVPRIAVAGDLCQGALSSLKPTPRSRSICAVRRPGPISPTVEAFWHELTPECPG